MIGKSLIPAIALGIALEGVLWHGGSISVLAAVPLSGEGGVEATTTGSKAIIRFVSESDADPKGCFEVSGITVPQNFAKDEGQVSGDDWSRIFAVYVVSASVGEHKALPPMFGSYSVGEGCLRFRPRFPIERGIRYRAVFFQKRLTAFQGKSPDRTGAADLEEPLTAEFQILMPSLAPKAFVKSVYPSVDRLPENQLKFYLYFSDPMSRGQGYRHIHLYAENGKEAELPFLEIDEELWDPTGTRLTLFFDPGRIKRGVRPREEWGPSLRVGGRYTLVIDREWQDAEGQLLVRDYRKSFSVAEPDYDSPSPKNWKLSIPAMGTKEPLVVCFDESLDVALATRLIWVESSSGLSVSGETTISNGERQWEFVPAEHWAAGEYHLIVGTVLEDLAGNSVARPFEVDAFPRVERRIEQTTVSRAFRIAAEKHQ